MIMHLYCKSMGKIFRVKHIAKDFEEANNYCRKHKDCGVIAETNNGLTLIAELYQIKVNSSVLPD